MKPMAIVACILLLLAGGASAAELQYSYGTTPPKVPLQTAATTGNGDECNLRSANSAATVTIDWSTGVDAGVVTVEVAGSCGYTGTWTSWAVIAFNYGGLTVPRQDQVGINQPVGCVRTRISTTVTTGTVSTTVSAVR